MQIATRIAVLILVVAGSSSCNVLAPESRSVDRSGGSGATVTPVCADDRPESDVLANLADGTGVLAIDFDSTIDRCSVGAYVVGADTKGAQRTTSGKTLITGVEAGSVDVIVTGSLAVQSATPTSSPLTSDATTHGIRLSGVSVLAAGQQSVKATLLPLAGISGRALLAGASNHEGIEVFIPGTSFLALTDSTGRYTISGVPAGKHDLAMRKDGYLTSRVAEVVMSEGKMTYLDDNVMVTGSGEGRLVFLSDAGQPLGDGATPPVVQSRRVRFAVVPTGNPLLMKIAEDGNFANLAWQPFKSTNTYTFAPESVPDGGRTVKTLSVALLDGDQQGELSADVFIDLFQTQGAESLVTLAGGAKTWNETILPVAVKPPTKATEMQWTTRTYVDPAGELRPFFGNAVWMPVKQAFDIDLTTWLKEKESDTYPEFKPLPVEVYVRFRTSELITSDVHSASVDLDLFPADALSYEIAAREVDRTYKPEFFLQGVNDPGSAYALLIGPTSDFSGATATTPVPATVKYALPDDADACGPHEFYVGLRHLASGFHGVARRESVTYRCVRDIPPPYFGGLNRTHHCHVFADDKFFVYGGITFLPNGTEIVANGGAIFDVSTGNWKAIPTIGGPGPRSTSGGSLYNRLVCGAIGGRFYVFAGNDDAASTLRFDGAIYDPAANSWQRIPEMPPFAIPGVVPYAGDDTHYHPTGRGILAWGMSDGTESSNDGFLLNFDAMIWTKISQAGAPTFRSYDNVSTSEYPSAFDEGRMIVWGGYHYDALLNTGAIYDVAADAWTAMSGTGAPAAREAYFRTVGKDGTCRSFALWGGTGTANPQIGGLYKFGCTSGPDGWVAGVPDGPSQIYASRFSLFPTVDEATSLSFRFGTKSIFFGGQSSSANPTLGGSIFDMAAPAADRWKDLLSGAQDEPAFRPGVSDALGGYGYESTAVKVRDRLLVVTRPDSNLSAKSNDVFVSLFDPASSTWSRLPSDKFPPPANAGVSRLFRDFSRVAATDDDFVLFGGLDPEDENHVYEDGVVISLGRSPVRLKSPTVGADGWRAVSAGETIELGFQVVGGVYPAENVTVTATVDGPATLVKNSVTVGDVAASTTKTVAPTNSLKLTVSGTAADLQYDQPIVVNLTVSSKHALSGDTYTGRYSWTLNVARARLTIDDVDFGAAPGISEGTTGDVYLTLANAGNETIPAGPLVVTYSPGTCVTAPSGSLTLPSALSPGSKVRLTSPISVTLAPSPTCNPGDIGSLSLTNLAYVNAQGRTLPLPSLNVPVDVGLHYTVNVFPDHFISTNDSTPYEVTLNVPSSIDAGQNAVYVTSRTYVDLDATPGTSDVEYTKIELKGPGGDTASLKNSGTFDQVTTKTAIRETYDQNNAAEADLNDVFTTPDVDADGDWKVIFSTTDGADQRVKQVKLKVFYRLI